MEIFKPSKNSQLWRFGWQFLFPWLFLGTILFAIAAAIAGSNSDDITALARALWVISGIFFAAGILAGFFGMLLLAFETVKSIKQNGEKLENILEMQARHRALLIDISKGSHLSDAAKEIAFRDRDQMELQEAVLAKLHQHDFDATTDMINEMARRPEYTALADKLKKMADNYRSGTEETRIRQAETHINDLIEKHQWSAAGIQIESLMKSYPESDKVRVMLSRLKEERDRRKRLLLKQWDDAVKREDVDQSLEILKELDLYLTPNEGLALQESASNVYRTKLHNLGVRFSMAVTEKRWNEALETGTQIIRQFPNSRMAHEIRSKMDILQSRSENQKNK